MLRGALQRFGSATHLQSNHRCLTQGIYRRGYQYTQQKENQRPIFATEDEDDDGVLFGVCLFAGTLISGSLICYGLFYATTMKWNTLNRFGRERLMVPAARDTVLRLSLDKSYSLYTDYLEEGKIMPCSLQSYQAVSQLLNRLVIAAVSLGATELGNIDWKIHLIDDMKPNITTLPDGNIFITKGLLVTVDKVEEVATILAHELGHIHGEHLEELYSSTAGRMLTLSAFIPLPLEGFFPETALNTLLSVKLNEYEEQEADSFAIKLLAQIGLDPEDSVEFWNKISEIQLADAAANRPVSLGRHDTSNITKRIENIRKQADQSTGVTSEAKIKE